MVRKGLQHSPSRPKPHVPILHSYYDRGLETLPRKDLDRLRLHLFKRTIHYAMERSAHYKAVLKDAKVDIRSIRTLDDISSVPVLSRFEVAFSQSSWPPFGDMLCVPEPSVATTVMTSGTTGRPIIVPLTENDSMHYCTYDSEIWRRTVHPIGRRKDDVFQSTWGHALDTWGASSLSFSRRRPCTPFVITSDIPIEQQLAAIHRLRTTVLVTDPLTYLELRKCISEMPEKKRNNIRLRAIFVGGSSKGKEITQWDIDAPCVQVLEMAWAAEIGLIGAQCQARAGLHVPEDHILVEVLDDDGTSVAPGENGELVITTLRREAMPFIRYRLGDMAALEPSPCPCGRTHMRLKGLFGKIGPRHMMEEVPGSDKQ